jgi:hypothetical protein
MTPSSLTRLSTLTTLSSDLRQRTKAEVGEVAVADAVAEAGVAANPEVEAAVVQETKMRRGMSRWSEQMWDCAHWHLNEIIRTTESRHKAT